MQENRLSKFFWWIYSEGSSNDSSKESNNSKSSKDLKREKNLKHSKATDAIDKETDKQLNSENIKAFQIEGVKVYVEWFPSIPVLLNTIKLRENNEHFGTSSHDNDKAFTGTDSYEEAEKLCLRGWSKPLETLEVAVNEELYKYEVSRKSTLRTTVAGYCPNVPNALMNLPNSMFLRESDKIENKVLHITYCMSVSWKTSTDKLIKAGSKLLAAIKILELQHVSISLDLCFFSAINNRGTEGIFNLLNVKNYGEQLDLLKLSFPLIHPSMFRRIGFASAETSPGPTEDFSTSYGHAPSIYEHKQALNLDNDSVVLNVDYLENCTIERVLTILRNELDK